MRKGQEEGLMVYGSLVVLIIIVLVFGILTIFSNRTNLELKAEMSSVESSKLTLLNYLRTPYEDGTMEDLIVEWYYDRIVEKKLLVETRKIFENVYSDCYALVIYENDDRILVFNNNKKRNLLVEQKIPLPDNNFLSIEFNPTKFIEDCS